MLFLPPIHSAIVPHLKANTPAHRALPFFVSTLYVRHIGESHWHDYTQLWYTISGSYTHTINGKKLEQMPGSLALIFPYTIHSVDTSESDIENLRVIRISIFEDLFGKNIMPFRTLSYDTSVFDKLILSPLVRFSGKNKESADILFEDILSEFSNHHDMNKKKIFADISKIFELLTQYNHTPIDNTKLLAAYEQFAVISEATSYIMQNHNRNTPLPEFAKQAYMSNNSFANKFKSCTGQTFLSFCTKIKIRHVIHLLRFSNKTLPEIAEECGFYDSAHLSHAVKSAFGVSPAVLKAQMLNHSITYGKINHTRQMEELEWLNLFTDAEKKLFHDLATGHIYK